MNTESNKPGRGLKRSSWPFIILAVLLLSASTSMFLPPFKNNIQRLVTDPLAVVALTGLTNDEQYDLRELYYARQYKPIWLEENKAKVEALFLLNVLKSADRQGLAPNDYFANKIASRIGSSKSKTLAELDILLTAATAKYMTHLHHGRFDYLSQKINATRFEVFLENQELHAIFSDFFHYETKHEQYVALKKQLSRLIDIRNNGGWPVLPNDATLKVGMNDVRIQLLKRRLQMTGDFPADKNPDKNFDKHLKNAIKSFQYRHRLAASGHADKELIDLLNIPVEQRIKQVSINLDRWRSIASKLGEDYVFVNTASYQLYGFRQGHEKLAMRVVVGEKDWETPQISSQIKEVILNPEWRVPHSIAIEEILPKLQEKGYSEKQFPYDFLQYRKKGRMVKVDPSKLKWERYNEKYFPFLLVQKPGTRNPLGKVKFFLPNNDNIYLHDTPYRSVFKTAKRSRSHGCIRLQKPMSLANFILAADSQWTRGQIRKTVKSEETTSIRLRQPIDVHLAYMTSWVDEQGHIAFYEDIYQRDPLILSALNL